MTGSLHLRAQQQKQRNDPKPLYEHLGGTSAERLAQYGRPRPDKKSVSRIVKLIWGQKVDYLFVADSGPGEADAKGLIVPRFGKNPENHVSVGLSWRNLGELLIMTMTHYQAWLTAQYIHNAGEQLSRYSDWSNPVLPRRCLYGAPFLVAWNMQYEIL